MGFILMLLLALIVVYFIAGADYDTRGHWSKPFVDLEVDPLEFYETVEDIFDEMKIPNIRTEVRKMAFLNRREYLFVYYDKYIFYIFAGPYGTSYFFSWWLQEKFDVWEKLLYKLPIVGPQFKKSRDYKSIYKLDIEEMFRNSVHTSVLEAIDRITTAKGIRGLTEDEKKPTLKALV
jgi:hypothetical protein